jgi:hypothetical protein
MKPTSSRVLATVLALPAVAVAVVDVAVNPWFADVPWLAVVPAVAAWRLHDRASRALAGIGAAALLAASLPPMADAPARVVVYGVDGATFDVLDGRAEELPAFAGLSAEGSRATLTSMEPMFSPLLWTTIASGRTPEEHGVRGFRVHADDCQVARFWDVAEADGRRIGLYKWLVDYPPRKVDGFWVPSWLAPAPETWPAELSAVKELELSKRMRRKRIEASRSTPELAWALVRIGVRLSTMGRAVAWSVEERVAHPDPVRANVQMQLLRGWIDRDVFIAQLHGLAPDVATFTYYATDGLAHLYWDRHVAGGDEVMSAYRQADAILADIRASLSEDARLIVVSDHGFKPMDGTGLAGQFAPLTERLRARIADAVGGSVDVSKVGHKLTVAVEADRLEAARALLTGLTDVHGVAFYRVEDTAGGTLGLTLADETITAERLSLDSVGGEPIKDYVALTDAYTGTHEARGVFLAAGDGVPRGGRLEALGLLDVAPTVLAAAGLPAATNMPGRAAVWPESPRVDSHDRLVLDLEWIDGDAGVDEERLKALGYVQ